MEKILIAFVLIIFNTIGQVLLKKAALDERMVNSSLWIGYAFFFVTIIISYFLMKHIELKYFTVVMSLNYVSIMFASALFFHESLCRAKILGTFFVLIGIFLFMKGI